MTDIVGLIAIAMSAFAATNIDDIFVLMLFFSSLTFPVRQVILGQYIGIGLLVSISALGSFISLVIPTYIIGLLGIAPIAIGAKKLLTLRKKNESNPKSKSKEAVQDKKNNDLAFAAVAAVTFSNGGDNIGVYTPLFAKYSTASQITTLSTIFMGMTAIWCIAAYYLVNHPLTASKIRRIGHIILPFVLIGLGLYILSESFVF
jgi:cadmium resistance protein CadD (predicted permease)